MGRNLVLTGVALLFLLGVFTGSAEPQVPHVWHVDDDRAEFPEADYVSI